MASGIQLWLRGIAYQMDQPRSAQASAVAQDRSRAGARFRNRLGHYPRRAAPTAPLLSLVAFASFALFASFAPFGRGVPAHAFSAPAPGPTTSTDHALGAVSEERRNPGCCEFHAGAIDRDGSLRRGNDPDDVFDNSRRGEGRVHCPRDDSTRRGACHH